MKDEAKADSLSVVGLALRRPYTFIVMAMLIVIATPFVLSRMAMDIFPEIDIPVISVIWNYDGLRRRWASASPPPASAA
jgi:multidrug efflux pump subunit AcrB